MNSLTLTNYILLSVITIVNVNLPNGDCRVEQDARKSHRRANDRSSALSPTANGRLISDAPKNHFVTKYKNCDQWYARCA